MKTLLTFLLTMANCRTDKPNKNQLVNQKGEIHLETCSRGCYQFILHPTTGDSKQRFYITNFPDSLAKFVLDAHNNQKDLTVLFSGKPSGDKHMVQGVGPDDRPTPLYELPSLQVSQMSRLP